METREVEAALSRCLDRLHRSEARLEASDEAIATSIAAIDRHNARERVAADRLWRELAAVRQRAASPTPD